VGLVQGERRPDAGGLVLDDDGRLIVVGPGGQPIAGGTGGTSGPVDIIDRAGRVLGTVDVNFPATQAVSDGGGSLTVDGTVTANPGTGPWPVTDNGGTLSVDDGAGSLTVDGSVSVSNLPAVRDVKDTARTPVVLSVAGVTSVTAETFLSLNVNKAGAATTGTTYTVPAGKTLRLQAIQFGARFATMSTTVTFANVTFRVRLGGATNSPLLLSDSKASVSNAATPNSDLAIPDGLELPAGTVLGVTQQASATTLLLDVILVGFEY
jgi:hypothetical protein